MKEFFKNCPKCNCIQTYTRKDSRDVAEKKKRVCNKCKPISLSHRKNMSIAHRGKSANNKGVPCSEEQKQKISKSKKGIPLSLEHRKNLSIATRIYSTETKYKVRQQRGHFRSWFIGKENGFEKYVGLSLPRFKLWLESKFKTGMNWDNHCFYGWHIDHQYPLSSFDLTKEDEIKKAWNFSNLFPMWAKDNHSKRSNKHISQKFFEY